MTILHVLDQSLPVHSGYTFRSRNIFLAQRRMGWNPVAVTSSRHEADSNPGGPSEQIDGITHYRTGGIPRSAIPGLYELKLIRRLAHRIIEVARIERPALIHAHSPVLTALAAARAARALRLPWVYEIRAFWEDAAVDHGTYAENSLKYRMVRWLESWICRRARAVAVLCEGIRAELVSRGIPSGKLTVVPNAVNLEELRPVPRDAALQEEWGLTGRRVVGFIGSFYRYEGLDLLLDAFWRVGARAEDIVLLLVGGGETESPLREQARRLGIEDRVIFLGRVPLDVIPRVYAAADVLAYPRYSMRLTELVTPLKPLEAMAMERPLVASDVGGHRELIQDGRTGILFPAGDAAALARALGRVLEDDRLRATLVREGAAWVARERSWNRTVERYRQVYGSVCERFGNDGLRGDLKSC